jgi:hypothetical protein
MPESVSVVISLQKRNETVSKIEAIVKTLKENINDVFASSFISYFELLAEAIAKNGELDNTACFKLIDEAKVINRQEIAAFSAALGQIEKLTRGYLQESASELAAWKALREREEKAVAKIEQTLKDY